jgi:Tfp pilus assembly protein PilX
MTIARLMRMRERGVVLPVVLVMLLLMTITVLFLMRRSTVDELLASNVRQIVTLETATQFALRSCERWLWVSVPGLAPRAGDPDPPPVVTAPAAAVTSAWRVGSNWTDFGVTLPADRFGAGITAVRCLFEDATAELELVTSLTATTATGMTTEPDWRKFRITAEVVGNNTVSRAQSEVRMPVPPT